MIGSISGIIKNIHDNKILIEQAGIGFEILCPESKNYSLNQSLCLQTYLHWSQEAGPTLFGFFTQTSKDIFILIIACPGIGPKLAVSILEQISAPQFLEIVSQQNISELSKLKGLGTKKAEQICIHLREKAPKLIKVHPNLATQTSLGLWSDLHDTLLSLHYSSTEIKLSMSALKENQELNNAPFDLLLRKALMLLAKK